MIKEREDNAVRGINHILDSLLESANDDINKAEIISRVRDTYSSICSAKHPFAEFYIWRENYEERLVQNKKLDEIKRKISTILF